MLRRQILKETSCLTKVKIGRLYKYFLQLEYIKQEKKFKVKFSNRFTGFPKYFFLIMKSICTRFLLKVPHILK